MSIYFPGMRLFRDAAFILLLSSATAVAGGGGNGGVPVPPCGNLSRCIVSSIPMNNPGIFSEADVQVIVDNLSSYSQQVNVELFTYYDLGMNYLSLSSIGVTQTLACDTTNPNNFLTQMHCAAQGPATCPNSPGASDYTCLPPWESIHHFIHTALSAAGNLFPNPRTSFVVRIEVPGNQQGAIQAQVVVSHGSPWAGVGVGGGFGSMTGWGAGLGVIGFVDHYYLNNQKPF